jgi:serine/threonine protein kinase
VDGVTLHDLVKSLGPLPPAFAANYVAQAAAGLQHIADCGLIHRDIKPSNLLLDRAGVVKILDLGLARFTGDDQDNVTRQFSGSTVLGTADYLSPEQALMADRIDIRADVYSLGATFYFLLTGRAPFEESTVPQKLLAHQLKEPAPPAGAPDDLTIVIRKMMQKNPAARYQHPGDVIDALAAWLTEELPPPDGRGSRGRAGPAARGARRRAPRGRPRRRAGRPSGRSSASPAVRRSRNRIPRSDWPKGPAFWPGRAAFCRGRTCRSRDDRRGGCTPGWPRLRRR